MKMSKLSNQTNSQDPQAINSRIFVGNLNTFQCSKTDVERMFQIYGRLAGISMHKGYAFVQFTNPFDARNACHGEDGRTVLSQTLDVNMVAEPKAHQIGRKRQNITKTGNDWDYFYDSYCSSALLRGNGIRPKKRKRLMSNSTSRLLNDVVSNGNLNAAVVAAAAQQQQQQQFNHQQQQHHHHSITQHQQQQHQQQQQQQQVAAVAMAAMANLLPQQQLLMHQQNMLTNVANGAAAAAAAAAAATSCNGVVAGVGGTPASVIAQHHQHHHANFNAYLQQKQQHIKHQHQHHHQQQQQQQQQHQQQQQQQQQQQAAGQYAAAAAAAVAAGLHLNSTSTTLTATASPMHNAASALIAAATNQTAIGQTATAMLPNNNDRMSTTNISSSDTTTATATAAASASATATGTGTGTGTTFNYANNNPTALNPTTTHGSMMHFQQNTLAKVTQPLALSMPTHGTQFLLNQQNQTEHQQQQPHQDNQQDSTSQSQQWGPFQFKIYSNADTLICGNCRECFSELAELLDHKRTYCKLRFTCKCQDVTFAAKSPATGAKLLCAVCKDAFANPWDLMVHAQAAHMVNIYELGDEDNNNNINNNNNNNLVDSRNINNNNNIESDTTCNEQINEHENQINCVTETVKFCITKDTNTIGTLHTMMKEPNNNTINNDTTPNETQLDLKKVFKCKTPTDENDMDCQNSNDAIEMNFESCRSPDITNKEDILSTPHRQRDDLSLDGHLSISSHQTHNSDDMKHLNGSVSSRGSSPAMDTNEQQQQQQPHQQQQQSNASCIVRTLSIVSGGI